MSLSKQLAFYLDDLWAKGFKLTDEEVTFIYFGKRSTMSEDWKVILALKTTLQNQQAFVGSYFLSLLELLKVEGITSPSGAAKLLKKKGIIA
ncbi:DUF6123 family protein [Radiobacillus deserti]|uniref:Uncharacterized protein n=1 Tax=Radiobacillus deserti TaxID=2594883 RepID=A0A516KGA2_9BACI|nr:DUF6123 family protein [Radiobacillus deserti]QDP40414.1 hypothetical protein FN924_09610 [Radiobacillus deserti]